MKIRTLQIFTFLSISIFFSVYSVYGEGSCPYQGQIDQCIEENKNGDPLSITEFVCPQTASVSEIAYQVVMDKKFKDIDKEGEKEVFDIEDNCDTWFGEKATEDELKIPDKITNIHGVHGKYWQKYNKLLDSQNKEGILATTINCLGGKSPNMEADDFFSPSLARGVFENHGTINADTSYDTLKLCKQKVRKDEQKKMMQQSRTKYDKVTDLFQSVIGYLERIWKKWPSKTRDNYL